MNGCHRRAAAWACVFTRSLPLWQRRAERLPAFLTPSGDSHRRRVTPLHPRASTSGRAEPQQCGAGQAVRRPRACPNAVSRCAGLSKAAAQHWQRAASGTQERKPGADLTVPPAAMCRGRNYDSNFRGLRQRTDILIRFHQCSIYVIANPVFAPQCDGPFPIVVEHRVQNVKCRRNRNQLWDECHFAVPIAI